MAKERLYGDNPLQITGGVDYAIAIEWAEASLELAEEQNGEDIATMDKIKNLITYAKKQHDEHFIPPTPEMDGVHILMNIFLFENSTMIFL